MTVRIRHARASDVSRMCRIDEEATPPRSAAQQQFDDRYPDVDASRFWHEYLGSHREVILVAEDRSGENVLGFGWWSRFSAAAAYASRQAGADEYSWDEVDDPQLLQMVHENRSHRQLFAPDTALLHLASIMVAPDTQRRGIGSLLVRAGRRIALREDRVHIAMVDTGTTFLERHGFRTRTRNIVNAALITGIPDLEPSRQYYMSDKATEHNAVPAMQ